MPTTFFCPHCEAKLQSGNPQIEGKRVRCAKCQATFTVTAGLIVREASPPSREAESASASEGARPRAKTKKKRKTASSSAIYWARTFIALALLIVIVTATLIILINKGWIELGN